MNALLPFMLPATAAALLAFCLTPLAARLAVRVGAVDMPGHRKIHGTPIPRLGGLAVVSAIALVSIGSRWFQGTWYVAPELAAGVAFGVLPILAVSIVDDIRQVQARTKFAFHLAGAIIAVACGISLGPEVHLIGQSIHLGMLALPVSLLWLVGVTNAFNIIDGLDGLSAGLALIASASMAAVFAMVGQPEMAAAALIPAGALAGFLPYNAHPARLFLGDTGATAIGFCLAAFALKGGSTLSAGFAALVPVFILGLPIADTLVAMARRLILRLERQGGGVFVADRNHIHHRLLALGISHGAAVLILYGAGMVFAGAAFVSIFLKVREAALFIVALVLAGLVGLNRLGYDEFAFIRRGTVLKVYETPVVKRSMFVVFVDIALVVFAAYAAVGLKSDVWALSEIHQNLFDLAGTFAPLTVIVFWKSGMYRGSWRLAGIPDLFRACSAAATVAILGLIGHGLWSPTGQPWTVFLIYGLVSTILVAASRASYVLLRDSQRRASTDGTPVVVYGAGKNGIAAVNELFDNPEGGLRPVGFIDDDLRTHGKVVAGLPVFGGTHSLAEILRSSAASGVVIATAAIREDRLAAVADTCARAEAKLYRMYLQFERLSKDMPVGLERLSPSADSAAPLPRPLAAAADPVLALLDAQTCGACGGSNVHRSRSRNFFERFRRARSTKRLYRCHDCGWRGWLEPLLLWPSETIAERSGAPDLVALDLAVPSVGVPQQRVASST